MSEGDGMLTACWRGEAIDGAEVERALGRMLREINPPETGEYDHPPTRTRVLNLVVCSAGDAPAGCSVETLWDLSERHPSRTLIVCARPGEAESGLDAAASAHCQLSAGVRGRVCYEEVRLVARGELASHLGSVVAPLLVPDLPVVLWWVGDPPSRQEELLRACDHLIVESDSFANSGLGDLALLVDTLSDRLVVGDLTWSALATWRELLAQLFDPPVARGPQREVTTARIRYAAGGPIVQPLLLLGWLATRLGWELAETAERTPDGATLIRFARPGGAVEANLVPVPPAGGLAAGEVAAVRLACGQENDEASFEVSRDCDGGCATQRASLPGTPPSSRVVPLTPVPLALRLGGELARASRDPGYEASLRLAARLL